MRSRFVVLAVGGLAVVGCKSGGGGAPADGGDTGNSGELSRGRRPDLRTSTSTTRLSPVGGRQGGWYTYGDDNGHFATEQRLQHRGRRGQPDLLAGRRAARQGDGLRMWGAAMGADWRAAPGRRRRRVRRQDDVRRQPVPRHRVLGEVVGAARRRAGQLPRPLHGRRRAVARHARSDRLQPSAVCWPPRLPLHLQRGLPVNCSPYLVQFGLKGDAAADVLFSGYVELPARHDLEALSGAVRRHEAGSRERRLPHAGQPPERSTS